jgi:copper chaperone CopZ
VTLKIRLHCDGCIDRIRRRVYKIKGVKDVAVDAGKDLVKVTGTMDAAALPGYLRDKLSRPVEVVKKDGGDKKPDGGDKKADGEKSKKEGGGGGGGGDDKKDNSVAPMPMADPSMYQMPPQYHGYHVPYNAAPGGYYGAAAAAPPPNSAFYPTAGPAAYYAPPPYASYPAHAPQMFSDENPNACSVM